MTEKDTDSEVQSFMAEGSESTDGPPAPDLQSFGRIAEEKHIHDHMKESELAAQAMKKQESLPGVGVAFHSENQLWHGKDTHTLVVRESEEYRDLEARVQLLEAELNSVKTEKKALEHQVTQVHDEYKREKRNAVADAERDKASLIEEAEHLRRTNDSASLLLIQKEEEIQQLRNELRTTKDLCEAINDTPGMKHTSAIDFERSHSCPLDSGEAVKKEGSPSSSICSLAEEKQIDELKAIQKALKGSKEEAQRMRQELTESAKDLQKERESKEEDMKKLKQQHRAEVGQLEAELKAAEDRNRQLQGKQARQEGLLGRLSQQHQSKSVRMQSKVKAAEDSTQQLQKEQVGQELVDELKGKLKAAEDTVHLLQKERDSTEEAVKSLKQHHQDECDKLKAEVEAAKDAERQLQKERDSIEEEVWTRKQQHQDDISELKTKVKVAEDKEKRCRNSSQIRMMAQEEETKRVNEKLQDATKEVGNLQVSACILERLTHSSLLPYVMQSSLHFICSFLGLG